MHWSKAQDSFSVSESVFEPLPPGWRYRRCRGVEGDLQGDSSVESPARSAGADSRTAAGKHITQAVSSRVPRQYHTNNEHFVLVYTLKALACEAKSFISVEL